MKVGTDGVLLGAWAAQEEYSQKKMRVLDVGVGTGLISLMLAQRFPYIQVTGIDIDDSSVKQARENVEASKFKERINVLKQDFRNIDYFFNKYDLIVSNPPFYKEKTLGGDNARDAARHNSFLPFDTLVANAVELLESNGIFSVIIPYGETGHFISICASHKLYLKRRMDVRSSEKKAFKRTLLEFSKTASSTLATALTLNAFDGSRTNEYTQLTKDFYL